MNWKMESVKKNIYQFSIFFFFFNYFLFSQTLKNNSQYEFEKYAVEQGTAMSASTVIFEDIKGYLWLGSQSGVDRFDGYDFINYANISSDSTSTNLTWVNSITQDKIGNIWATDEFGNVSNYKRLEDRWINYYPVYKDSITNVPEGANLQFSPQPRSILISDDGRYAYVGVYRFGLIRIDSKTGLQKFYQDDFKYSSWNDINSADKMINEMEWLDEKRILIATGDGLRVFDVEKENYTKNYFRTKKKKQDTNWPSDRYWIRNFEIIDKNNLWICARNGIIYKANLEEEILENYSEKTNLSNSDATFILLDKENSQLWVNIQNVGIDILDINTNEVINLRDYNSPLIGKEFNNIIKDNQQNIWISSSTDGLLKYDPNKKKFKSFGKDKPQGFELGFSVTWGAYIDKNGIVWVGTRDPGGGIVGLDFKNNKRFFSAKSNNNSTSLYSITEDNVGNIWAIRSGDGILLKKKDEEKFKWLGSYTGELRKDKSYLTNLVQGYLTYDKNLIVPSERTVWLSDKNGNPVFEEYTKLTNVVKSNIRAFHRKDSVSSYVIADKSVWLWNEKDNKLRDLTPDVDVPIFETRAQSPVAAYKDKLYIPTYGNGILVVNIKTQKVSYITVNEGLPNMYLYNMFLDNDNFLWMSSNQGILKYDPNTLEFKQYTPVDGTQEYEYNAGTAWQSDDGYIVMGGLNGINYFNPSTLNENRLPPKVLIQNINMGGEVMKFESDSNDEFVEIDYNNNSISFEYLALSFRNTDQNQYRYKMEGYDEEWIDAGTRRFVSYTNLPIGSYTFRVLGSNNDGIWNEVGASYKLTILPPWYRTYFAYISYVLFLIFGFRSFGRYQAKKSLEKAENERRAGELEEAKELQNSLLPKVLPNVTGFEISTYLKPATEIGGDYYDFFYEKDNYFYAICGDATGHGVVSGIMVSVTKAGLNGIPMGNPSTILGQLNRIVKRVNFGRLRMSLSVAKFNESSVELSSAAMPPTYFFSSKSKKIEEVLVPNLPLGGIEGEKFDGIKKEFDSGDVMVMISDGLPELPNPTDEMLDYEKVYSCIKKNAEKSADEIKDALVYLSDDWAKGVMNPDDITIVVIKKAA